MNDVKKKKGEKVVADFYGLIFVMDFFRKFIPEEN